MVLHDIDADYLVEDRQFECKARLDRENIMGWLKTVDGFANAKGGVFYLGVEDKSNKLIGFRQNEIDQEKLFFFHTVKQHMAILPDLLTRVISYENHDRIWYLLKIEVRESKQKPLVLKYQGMPMIFVRRDGYTDAATEEEIRTMVLSSQTPQFDTQMTDHAYREEDFRTFFDFYAERNNGRYPTEKELASIGCFDEDKNLSEAFYLFSDRYDGSRTKVNCSLFRGKTRGDDVILSSNSFQGNLISDYRFIMEFVRARMNHGFIKTAEGRKDVDAYPGRALFEAVINALAHRDYLLTGTEIHVDLFVDRLVISSPGSLFNGGVVKPTHDLTSFISRRRNQLISAIFVYAHAMEAKGTGFEKIAEDYKDQNSTHKPYLFSKNNQFTIVLPDRTNPNGISLGDEQVDIIGNIQGGSKYDAAILGFCYANSRTVKSITEHLQLADSSFFRAQILENLVNQGFLLREQKGRTSFYRSNPLKVRIR